LLLRDTACSMDLFLQLRSAQGGRFIASRTSHRRSTPPPYPIKLRNHARLQCRTTALRLNSILSPPSRQGGYCVNRETPKLHRRIPGPIPRWLPCRGRGRSAKEGRNSAFAMGRLVSKATHDVSSGRSTVLFKAMAGRHCRYVQRDHGGVGHLGGQCQPAPYRRESLLYDRRSHLGPHILHCCQRNHLPITGWLSNYFGRKRLLFTVVTGFTLSSVLCGLAPSLPFLIFFRVVQGITGGGLQPLSQSVMLEEFPGRERGKGMAFWSLGIIAAPVLGPTLGGWITDNYSWRWVFYINLPIGIISLILISLFIYDPAYIKRGTMRFDAWGMGMLASGWEPCRSCWIKGRKTTGSALALSERLPSRRPSC